MRVGRRLTPWSRVTRVVAGGTPAGPNVRLFYTHATGGLGGLSGTRELFSDATLPVAEYEALADRLRRGVVPAHSHLHVGDYAPVGSLTGG